MADRDELLFPDEDDRPLFADEPAQPAASTAAEPAEAAAPWRILIVDDEADVHSVTTFMLRGQQYLGRGFEFLHAYSGREARDILAANPDLAVVLLDVVMETEDSGLQLVHYIREELGNRTVRIVLRTGQPGKAPAARVIVEYDINDYKEKTELTLEKMLVTLISALRSYHFITTIENNRRGLKRIIEASGDIFERQSLERLGRGVLDQLTAILELRGDPESSGGKASGLTAAVIDGRPLVLAATGAFSPFEHRPVAEVDTAMMRTALDLARTRPRGFYCQNGSCAWYFKSQNGSENFLYFEIPREVDEDDHDLLELFFTNVSLAFDNLFLNQGIEDTQKEIIFQIAETMECRSAETGSHVRRVAEYARLLALKVGLSEDEAEMLKLASTPHDRAAHPGGVHHHQDPRLARPRPARQLAQPDHPGRGPHRPPAPRALGRPGLPPGPERRRDPHPRPHHRRGRRVRRALQQARLPRSLGLGSGVQPLPRGTRPPLRPAVGGYFARMPGGVCGYLGEV